MNDPIFTTGEVASHASSAEPTSEQILDPVRQVPISGGRIITVRELSWRELRRLIGRVTAQMDKILAINPGTGQVSLHMEQLADVVLGDVSEAFVSAAADLTIDQLGDLRGRDYTALLAAAIALNVHPEMVAAGKAVAARVTALRAA